MLMLQSRRSSPLWQDAVPLIENWWQELYDDIVNDPNLSDAEQTEALAELGSIEDFVGNLRSRHVAPVIQRIQQSTERLRTQTQTVTNDIRQGIEALETRTASRVANDALNAIGEAASDVNVTEQTILELWDAAVPLIENWLQELRDDILNDPNLNASERTEALAGLGSVADFVGNLKSQYVTPVIRGIREGIEALQTRTASRIANAAIQAIGDAASDVNVTEQTIVAFVARRYTEYRDMV